MIVVVDLGTLWAATRPLPRSAAVGRFGFWHGLHRTSDASGRTLVYDNAASVLGGLLGIGRLAVHQLTGDARADAVASLAIGVVLLATTALLLRANRELLTDHSLAPDVLDAMRGRIAQQHGVVEVPELVAIYTGPMSTLVTGTVALDASLDLVGVQRTITAASDALHSRWPGEIRVYPTPVPAVVARSG